MTKQVLLKKNQNHIWLKWEFSLFVSNRIEFSIFYNNNKKKNIQVLDCKLHGPFI